MTPLITSSGDVAVSRVDVSLLLLIAAARDITVGGIHVPLVTTTGHIAVCGVNTGDLRLPLLVTASGHVAVCSIYIPLVATTRNIAVSGIYVPLIAASRYIAVGSVNCDDELAKTMQHLSPDGRTIRGRHREGRRREEGGEEGDELHSDGLENVIPVEVVNIVACWFV